MALPKNISNKQTENESKQTCAPTQREYGQNKKPGSGANRICATPLFARKKFLFVLIVFLLFHRGVFLLSTRKFGEITLFYAVIWS